MLGRNITEHNYKTALKHDCPDSNAINKASQRTQNQTTTTDQYAPKRGLHHAQPFMLNEASGFKLRRMQTQSRIQPALTHPTNQANRNRQYQATKLNGWYGNETEPKSLNVATLGEAHDPNNLLARTTTVSALTLNRHPKRRKTLRLAFVYFGIKI